MGKDRAGKLILVRHGESEGNRDRRFTTSPAAALTDLGRRQAKDAAARIRVLFTPELVIASPFARARETGEIIARELSAPFEVREGLHEQSFGSLAGQPYDVAAQATDLDPKRPWLWCPPGGESREQVRRRVAPILDELAARHLDTDVVVVSHGAVMSALWAHVTDSWEQALIVGNAGIVVVEHVGRRYSPPRMIVEEEQSR